MKDYRIYFCDGNQRIFSARNMYVVLNYLAEVENVNMNDIVKVEEIK